MQKKGIVHQYRFFRWRRYHSVKMCWVTPTAHLHAAELEKMKSLTKQAMEDGALGIGSALIYAPGAYAKTDELIELCKVASSYGGTYISHIRSEGNQLLEGADELIHISKEASIPAIFYHLKAAGKGNWKDG